MTGTKAPKAWELWYANVKYEDMDFYQDRLVLVVDTTDGIYILALKVTSTPQRSEWGEYDITKWKSAGLDNPSTVRCSHSLNLMQKDFRRKIGDLQFEDISRIMDLIMNQ